MSQDKPKIKFSIKIKANKITSTAYPTDEEESEKKKRPAPQPTQSVKRKKITLSNCLDKLITMITQRDNYGFFLYPVDTSLVPDYSNIIKNPMDLGTMRDKVTKKLYKDCEDFKKDFILVVRNAKLYNAPDTIYFKAAEKLEQSGLRIIERETVSVVPDEEEEVVQSPEMSEKPKIREEEPKKEKKKKIKHWEDLENIMFQMYNPDGTIYHENSHILGFFKKLPYFFQETLSDIDLNSLSHCWITSLEPNPIVSSNEAEFNYYLGEDKGRAYVESLERFTKDLKYNFKEKELTRGAHSIAKATRNVLEKKKESDYQDTECGQVSIKSQIQKLTNEAEILFRNAEREIFKKNANKCAFLSQPIGPSEQVQISTIEQAISDNKQEFQKILAMPVDSRKPHLEKVRKRLLQLVEQSNHTDFETTKSVTVKVVQQKAKQSPKANANAGASYNAITSMLAQQRARPQIWQPMFPVETRAVEVERKCINCNESLGGVNVGYDHSPEITSRGLSLGSKEEMLVTLVEHLEKKKPESLEEQKKARAERFNINVNTSVPVLKPANSSKKAPTTPKSATAPKSAPAPKAKLVVEVDSDLAQKRKEKFGNSEPQQKEKKPKIEKEKKVPKNDGKIKVKVDADLAAKRKAKFT
ncbi:Bromodomain containing protein 7 [Terramyces sp. JEL0728]|nr:Bromodomain containing protein 7 [Terramyces sp. JEL0728]